MKEWGTIITTITTIFHSLLNKGRLEMTFGSINTSPKALSPIGSWGLGLRGLHRLSLVKPGGFSDAGSGRVV